MDCEIPLPDLICLSQSPSSPSSPDSDCFRRDIESRPPTSGEPPVILFFCPSPVFADYYTEQSCTAGRSAFTTGQAAFRTGLSEAGMPGGNAETPGRGRDNLLHRNAEEEPVHPDYPKNYEFREKFGPRRVLDTRANDKNDRTSEPR